MRDVVGPADVSQAFTAIAPGNGLGGLVLS
jgi:hypothetical protein